VLQDTGDMASNRMASL